MAASTHLEEVFRAVDLSVEDLVEVLTVSTPEAGGAGLDKKTFVSMLRSTVEQRAPRSRVRVESEALEQELGEAFESMDADHDGTLTIGELAAGLGVFASGTQQSKISALFKLFDTNGDGNISLEEMHAMLGALFRAIAARDGFDVPRSKLDALVSATADRAFKEADLNSDGRLTLSEFTDWYTSGPDMTAHTPTAEASRGRFACGDDDIDTDEEDGDPPVLAVALAVAECSDEEDDADAGLASGKGGEPADEDARKGHTARPRWASSLPTAAERVAASAWDHSRGSGARHGDHHDGDSDADSDGDEDEDDRLDAPGAVIFSRSHSLQSAHSAGSAEAAADASLVRRAAAAARIFRLSSRSVADVQEYFAAAASAPGAPLDQAAFTSALAGMAPQGASMALVRSAAAVLFKLFDSDSDARVSAAELSAGMAVCCGGSSATRLDALFDQFDADADGRISVDELATFMAAVLRAAPLSGSADVIGVSNGLGRQDSARVLAGEAASMSFAVAGLDAASAGMDRPAFAKAASEFLADVASVSGDPGFDAFAGASVTGGAGSGHSSDGTGADDADDDDDDDDDEDGDAAEVEDGSVLPGPAPALCRRQSSRSRVSGRRPDAVDPRALSGSAAAQTLRGVCEAAGLESAAVARAILRASRDAAREGSAGHGAGSEVLGRAQFMAVVKQALGGEAGSGEAHTAISALATALFDALSSGAAHGAVSGRELAAGLTLLASGDDIDRLRMVFDALDVDASGTLTAAELFSGVVPVLATSLAAEGQAAGVSDPAAALRGAKRLAGDLVKDAFAKANVHVRGSLSFAQFAAWARAGESASESQDADRGAESAAAAGHGAGGMPASTGSTPDVRPMAAVAAAPPSLPEVDSLFDLATVDPGVLLDEARCAADEEVSVDTDATGSPTPGTGSRLAPSAPRAALSRPAFLALLRSHQRPQTAATPGLARRAEAVAARVFDSVDADGNGAVDLAEVAAGLAVFMAGPSTGAARNALSLMDLNGDGRVSMWELQAFTTALARITAEALGPSAVGANLANIDRVVVQLGRSVAEEAFALAGSPADEPLSMTGVTAWLSHPRRTAGLHLRGLEPVPQPARQPAGSDGATSMSTSSHGSSGGPATQARAPFAGGERPDMRATLARSRITEAIDELRRRSGLIAYGPDRVAAALATRWPGAGGIDRAGFIDALAALLAEPDDSGRPYSGEDAEALANNLFDAWDVDHDGAADFSEITAGIVLLCGGGSPAHRVRVAFELFDASGSGAVNPGQMRVIMAAVFRLVRATAEGPFHDLSRGADPEQLAAVSTDRAFAECDLNRDGHLSRSEFERWYGQAFAFGGFSASGAVAMDVDAAAPRAHGGVDVDAVALPALPDGQDLLSAADSLALSDPDDERYSGAVPLSPTPMPAEGAAGGLATYGSAAALGRALGLYAVEVGAALSALAAQADEDGMLSAHGFSEACVYMMAGRAADEGWSQEEFMAEAGRTAPLFEQLFEVYDEGRAGEAPLGDIVVAVALVCRATDAAARWEAVFNAVDEEGEGFISGHSMAAVLHAVFRLSVATSPGALSRADPAIAAVEVARSAVRGCSTSQSGLLSKRDFVSWMLQGATRSGPSDAADNGPDSGSDGASLGDQGGLDTPASEAEGPGLEAMARATGLFGRDPRFVMAVLRKASGADGMVTRAAFNSVILASTQEAAQRGAFHPGSAGAEAAESSRMHVAHLFDLFDPEGTGAASFASLASGIAMLCGSHGPASDTAPALARRAAAQSRARAAFLAFDLDHDGRLGAREMCTFLTEALTVVMTADSSRPPTAEVRMAAVNLASVTTARCFSDAEGARLRGYLTQQEFAAWLETAAESPDADSSAASIVLAVAGAADPVAEEEQELLAPTPSAPPVRASAPPVQASAPPVYPTAPPARAASPPSRQESITLGRSVRGTTALASLAAQEVVGAVADFAGNDDGSIDGRRYMAALASVVSVNGPPSQDQMRASATVFSAFDHPREDGPPGASGGDLRASRDLLLALASLSSSDAPDRISAAVALMREADNEEADGASCSTRGSEEPVSLSRREARRYCKAAFTAQAAHADRADALHAASRAMGLDRLTGPAVAVARIATAVADAAFAAAEARTAAERHTDRPQDQVGVAAFAEALGTVGGDDSDDDPEFLSFRAALLSSARAASRSRAASGAAAQRPAAAAAPASPPMTGRALSHGAAMVTLRQAAAQSQAQPGAVVAAVAALRQGPSTLLTSAGFASLTSVCFGSRGTRLAQACQLVHAALVPADGHVAMASDLAACLVLLTCVPDEGDVAGPAPATAPGRPVPGPLAVAKARALFHLCADGHEGAVMTFEALAGVLSALVTMAWTADAGARERIGAVDPAVLAHQTACGIMVGVGAARSEEEAPSACITSEELSEWLEGSLIEQVLGFQASPGADAEPRGQAATAVAASADAAAASGQAFPVSPPRPAPAAAAASAEEGSTAALAAAARSISAAERLVEEDLWAGAEASAHEAPRSGRTSTQAADVAAAHAKQQAASQDMSNAATRRVLGMPQLSLLDVVAALRECQRNSPPRVTREAFERTSRCLRRLAGQPEPRDIPPSSVFDAMDSDEDGNLSALEVAMGLMPLAVSSREAASVLFRCFDRPATGCMDALKVAHLVASLEAHQQGGRSTAAVPTLGNVHSAERLLAQAGEVDGMDEPTFCAWWATRR